MTTRKIMKFVQEYKNRLSVGATFDINYTLVLHFGELNIVKEDFPLALEPFVGEVIWIGDRIPVSRLEDQEENNQIMDELVLLHNYPETLGIYHSKP